VIGVGEESSITRRKMMKGLAAVGSVLGIGGAVELDRYGRLENVFEETGELKDGLAKARQTNSDENRVYLGNVNTYDPSIEETIENNPDGTTNALFNEDTIDLDVIYLREELSDETFQRIVEEEINLLLNETDPRIGSKPTVDGIIDKLGSYTPDELTIGVGAAAKAAQEGWDELPDDYTSDMYERFTDATPLEQAYLERLVRRIELEYDDVLPDSVDLDVEYTVEQVDDAVEDAIKFGRSKLGELNERFRGDSSSLPVYLTARHVGGDDNKAFSRGESGAMVHIPSALLLDDPDMTVGLFEQLMQHLSIHEAGHSLFHMPHQAYPDGVMSYNDWYRMLPEDHLSFNEREEMIVDRLYHGEDIEAAQANSDFIDHLTVYLEDLMGFSMDEWDVTSYDPEEDRITWTNEERYRHSLLDQVLDDYGDENYVTDRREKQGERGGIELSIDVDYRIEDLQLTITD
jgi:hypothetical protein